MDLRSNNQHAAAAVPAGRASSDEGAARHHNMLGAPTWASKTLVILLIVLSVLVLGVLGTTIFSAATTQAATKSKQYQALFLTNGQVYFGKLTQVDAQYVKLSDIYYLQIQQQVQPTPQNQQNQQQPQVSLAKLGGELHGPEDTMYVSREQVLFWENLKNDGKVAKAITDYKNTNK